MSPALVFGRCVRGGLRPWVWIALVALAGLAGVLALAGSASTASQRYAQASLPLSWLPVLPALVAGFALLEAWPAHSPSQPGYRHLWLLRAPIRRCRLAAWLGIAAATLPLLLAIGGLLGALIGVLAAPSFARTQRLAFAETPETRRWVRDAGDHQLLPVPPGSSDRRLVLEPRYLAFDWVPVHFEAQWFAAGEPTSDAPRRTVRFELDRPEAVATLELPEELAAGGTLRLVRTTRERSFAVSFANGRTTLRGAPVPTLRAGMEISLRHLPWAALALALLVLVARFAPPALQAAGWLALLPGVSTLPGLELPETARLLLHGEAPVLGELALGPLPVAALCLLLAQWPAAPTAASRGVAR